jgi:two-component system alkaline phosphatase synthesis response regulator PhoP
MDLSVAGVVGDGLGRVRRRRVLVVDDDPSVALLLTKALESDGHVVRAATRSLRVYGTAQEFKPDLILMDVSMPYLDGFDLLRLLALDGSLADVPIVLVTGVSNARARVASQDKPLRRRIVDCVCKPFDVDALLSKVAAVPFSAAPVPQ